ncbi:LCP family protein [Paramicrobacterium fandaimingii]|uniref:LCP family protein n=1 Tax=Paramicrobacterium fandaimingii TaxID=2708079 RepID=UPI0014210658|nr:LCP family protein [Microbacterium fandaimingii]
MSRRDANEAPVRHGRQPRRSGLRTTAKVVIASVAVLALTVVGVAAWGVADVFGRLDRGGVSLPGNSGQPIPDVNAIEGGFNLLLVGSDSREGQGDGFGDPKQLTGQLNDVTILVHISEDHSNATAISIPRDTFVDVPACPYPQDEDGTVPEGEQPPAGIQKVNRTLKHGGLGCTAATVQELTGLTVHYAGAIQFNGVTAMANAIGGVEVCLSEPIVDPKTNLDLPAGDVTLKGETALQFLRTRYGVGDGSDLGRISNQQVYMSALMRKILSGETLSNPVKLYKLANVAADNMTLSTELSNANTMVSIALALKGMPTENITFVKYPTGSGMLNGQEGEIPVEADAAALLDAVKADRSLSITGGTGEYGAVPKDGDSTEPPADDGETTPPEDDATAPPSADGPVELPDSVKGQTAADETCSNGNG